MLATKAPDLVEILPGGKARLHLHEGQAKADRSKRRFTFVVAGTQSGKTSWGPWWLAEEISAAPDSRTAQQASSAGSS